jgi:DNA-binding MarR family transcriptional regulator
MNASNFGSQLQTYYTIRAYVTVNKHAPTVTELATLRHLTACAIQTHLKQLEQRGLITRVKGWRNIRLTARAA